MKSKYAFIIIYPIEWTSQVVQWQRIHLPTQETWVWFWVGKIPWRRKWQPTPVFLPGNFQRSLAGYVQYMGLKRAGHDWTCMHPIEKCNMFCNTFYIHSKNVFHFFLLFSYFSSLGEWLFAWLIRFKINFTCPEV